MKNESFSKGDIVGYWWVNKVGFYNNMRVLLFIFSVLFSILIYSQEIGNNVYVKHTEYRINNYGSFFQDLILNDSGLIIIRRGSKRNVVFTRSYVDSVFVPIAKTAQTGPPKPDQTVPPDHVLTWFMLTVGSRVGFSS